MTKEELEARLNAAEKEIADLKAKLNEVSEIPDYPEFQKDAQYYYLHPHLCISQIRNVFPNRTDDFNAFHTFEYAKEFVDICCKTAILLHCKWYVDRNYIPNWKDVKEPKYFLYFDPKEDKYDVTHVVYNLGKYPMVFFSNKDAAQKAADWMNKRHKQERSD